MIKPVLRGLFVPLAVILCAAPSSAVDAKPVADAPVDADASRFAAAADDLMRRNPPILPAAAQSESLFETVAIMAEGKHQRITTVVGNLVPVVERRRYEITDDDDGAVVQPDTGRQAR